MAKQKRTYNIIKIPGRDGQTEPKELKGMEPFNRVWQISKDAWGFKGEPVDESKLHRHVGRLFEK